MLSIFTVSGIKKHKALMCCDFAPDLIRKANKFWSKAVANDRFHYQLFCCFFSLRIEQLEMTD